MARSYLNVAGLQVSADEHAAAEAERKRALRDVYILDNGVRSWCGYAPAGFCASYEWARRGRRGELKVCLSVTRPDKPRPYVRFLRLFRQRSLRLVKC